MTETIIHKIFTPIKNHFPYWVYDSIRRFGTAILGPLIYAFGSGYVRSSLKRAAVTKTGEPIPWYTYPSIDFLKVRDFKKRNILEFGGGQSTLWWAKRAEKVITLEGDQDWYFYLKNKCPKNVELHHVIQQSRHESVKSVNRVLNSNKYTSFDVIIIDGLYRENMIPISMQLLSIDGIIICDDSENYSFHELFKDTGLMRVDFFGNVPGVILPHTTSIYFKPSSFVFNSNYPIPVRA